jgi:phosphoenolpyruvate-protein kinase (PTS system EI component)
MSNPNREAGLLPEAASVVVEGIAIGHAVVWAADPPSRPVAGTIAEERARLVWAIRRATRGVEELVRLLQRGEAELFEPEVAILGELGPLMLARVDAGVSAEDAVNATTSELASDLLVDARSRLLDGLAHDSRSVESLLEGREGERILVTETLTPSVVASLPGRVVGIVASTPEGPEERGTGHTSHAAILARGRVIPLVLASRQAIARISNDDLVVLDASTHPASVWVTPDDSIVADARSRREAWTRNRGDEKSQVTASLAHLRLEVHVNVGSIHEHVPSSADGIGLVRTELIFAHSRRAPGEMEQFGVLRAIGARLARGPVVVRLFDAGGDKPLPWLRAPDSEPGLRGIALLLTHATVLDTQLRSIERAAATTDVRVLLPLVTCAGDVERVRALTHKALPVGAMIETPQAVDQCEAIAGVSDFICIGTNDLFASVTGQGQGDATLSLDTRVLRMIERIVTAARRHARKVTVCGEMAGEAHTARILLGLGVDAISVATERFAKVKLSFRDVTIEDCREVALEALK